MSDNVKVVWGDSRIIKNVTIAPMVEADSWTKVRMTSRINRFNVLKSKGQANVVLERMNELFIGKSYQEWLDYEFD